MVNRRKQEYFNKKFRSPPDLSKRLPHIYYYDNN